MNGILTDEDLLLYHARVLRLYNVLTRIHREIEIVYDADLKNNIFFKTFEAKVILEGLIIDMMKEERKRGLTNPQHLTGGSPK